MTHKLHFSSKLSTIIKCTFSSQFFNLGNLNFRFYFAATRQSDGLQMEDTNSRKKSRQEVGCSLTSLNNHTFWKKQKFKHHHEKEEKKNILFFQSQLKKFLLTFSANIFSLFFCIKKKSYYWCIFIVGII